MVQIVQNRISFLILATLLVAFGCGSKVEPRPPATPTPAETVAAPSPSPTPAVPNLQVELLDNENSTTAFPIGTFDFKNYTYELPRGWQNPDGTTEITLTNGRVAPVSTQTKESMDEDAKAVAKAQRRIGLSYVATKFFDVTGDGEDEADRKSV